MGTEAIALSGAQGTAFVGVGRNGQISGVVESTDSPERTDWNVAEVGGSVVVVIKLPAGVTEAKVAAQGEAWALAKARDALIEGGKTRITNPAKLAATATVDTGPTLCPFTGTVTAVTYEPVAGITGADTNSLTVSLVNKGQAGAGNVVVATKAFTNGVNAAISPAETTLTVQGGGADAVVKGDQLYVRSAKVGTGLADPGGTIRITISPTAG